MSATYTPTFDGYFAEVSGPDGTVTGTIHRPREGRACWRLCYAGCTGAHTALLGKVIDADSLGAIKGLLAIYDREAT